MTHDDKSNDVLINILKNRVINLHSTIYLTGFSVQIHSNLRRIWINSNVKGDYTV